MPLSPHTTTSGQTTSATPVRYTHSASRLFTTVYTCGASVLHVRDRSLALVQPLSISGQISQQSTTELQTPFTDNWIKIILGYARHRRLFTLRIEDAEAPGGDWDEVLRNPRINRAPVSLTSVPTYTFVLTKHFSAVIGRVQPQYLSYLLSELVKRKQAAYDPPKQTRSVLLHWRLPEEWADALHEWVRTCT
jgi:hypothetical protein